MIGRNDPAPFEVVNRDGRAPLVIACDHAENRIPESLQQLGLDPAHLQQHIAYDIGAKQVALQLSEMFDAPLITAGYSRLVIDLNRHLHDDTLIAASSDNIEIPGNESIDDSERNKRIDSFFHPYHNCYAELVDQVKSLHSNPIVLSVHSFTPEYDGHSRPWGYGVLWDDFHENISKKLLTSLSQHTSHVVGDNKPYHANYPQGYSQVVHAEQKGIEMALIEIRQDLIENADGQTSAAKVLFNAIKPLID